MNRREFFTRASFAIGAGLTTRHSYALEAAWGWHNGQSGNSLTKADLTLIAEIGEIIIPETDTPGARGAGVEHYIDYMVTNWMTNAARTEFKSGLTAFQDAFGDFLSLRPKTQFKILSALDQRLADTSSPITDKLLMFYRDIKDWVTIGYFTSEIGMADYSAYHPLPGPPQDVSYDDWLAYQGWGKANGNA